MGNIILSGVTVFVVVMIAIGMKRGLVKTAFSFGSIFIALILVNILTPVAKEVIKNTPVYVYILAIFIFVLAIVAVKNMKKSECFQWKKLLAAQILQRTLFNILL